MSLKKAKSQSRYTNALPRMVLLLFVGSITFRDLVAFVNPAIEVAQVSALLEPVTIIFNGWKNVRSKKF